jgi:hypothetical protein
MGRSDSKHEGDLLIQFYMMTNVIKSSKKSTHPPINAGKDQLLHQQSS